MSIKYKLQVPFIYWSIPEHNNTPIKGEVLHSRVQPWKSAGFPLRCLPLSTLQFYTCFSEMIRRRIYMMRINRIIRRNYMISTITKTIRGWRKTGKRYSLWYRKPCLAILLQSWWFSWRNVQVWRILLYLYTFRLQSLNTAILQYWILGEGHHEV